MSIHFAHQFDCTSSISTHVHTVSSMYENKVCICICNYFVSKSFNRPSKRTIEHSIFCFLTCFHLLRSCISRNVCIHECVCLPSAANIFSAMLTPYLSPQSMGVVCREKAFVRLSLTIYCGYCVRLRLSLNQCKRLFSTVPLFCWRQKHGVSKMYIQTQRSKIKFANIKFILSLHWLHSTAHHQFQTGLEQLYIFGRENIWI